MSNRAWTQADVDALNYRLAGKTIKRVQLMRDGIINIVTTDAEETLVEAESGPVEEEQKP